ncbi:hypothetical protein VTJ49DRAFT_2806 [Mycothermus thermophilus]|uniref:Glycosyl hydrolase n=1 Tax=Humicola insolens TaxID=85995 RepID=A0ABR3VA53_HUMIN
MVLIRWAGLAFLAVNLAHATSGHLTSRAPSAENILAAAEALQGWYNPSKGLWDSTNWWNSANCLTVLANWALVDVSRSRQIDVPSIIANTFEKAQRDVLRVRKTIRESGLIESRYDLHANKRGFTEFLNEYYDDEGWWALALIRAWDVTRHGPYLDMAERIFRDMQGGVDDTCGGGIWWSKARDYKNAIANELYLSVAASLANRVPTREGEYVRIAADTWAWFKASGMINQDGLVNDGLDILPDGRCVNNGRPTWTYNQGVLLGGLVELAVATGNGSVLDQAVRTAKAALAALTDDEGILREATGCEPNCGADGSQFKGIFMRNLAYLQRAAPNDEFLVAILRNADAVWAKNRNEKNQFGISWSGPPEAGGGPNASTHSSALDVVVAARAVVEANGAVSNG